jgi:hypothetical protein
VWLIDTALGVFGQHEIHQMAPQIGENSAITLESRNYDYHRLRKHALCDAVENHLIK